MRSFLSRCRFELLALALAAVACALHGWVDASPAMGLQEGDRGTPLLVRAVHLTEGRVTDLQFRARGPRQPHPSVVVVAVDEKSAQAHGRWPWPRSLLAKAIDRLREAGVGAVGLDMTFTDEAPDDAARAYAQALQSLDKALSAAPPGAASVLAAYREELQTRGAANPDAALAEALTRTPQVVQGLILYPEAERAQFAQQEAERGALLQPHLLRRFPGSVPGSFHEVDLATVPSWRMYSAQLPVPVLARASPRLGFLNTVPDLDGALRRAPVFGKVERHQGLLASLEVQTAAAFLGADSVEPLYDPVLGRLVGARLRRQHGAPLVVPLPLDEPYVRINYPGPSNVFPTLSLADVLDGRFDPEAVRGKAVLVGVTLVGNYDQRVTPFKEFEPGVYVHAAVLSNILAQDFLTRPEWLRALELLFMLGGALLLGRLLPRVRFAWKLGAVALLAAGWLALDQALFTLGLHLATVLPLLSTFLSGFGVLFLGYVSVDAEKAKLRNAFQHYLDASVMEQVLAHPEKLKLGGERKELTVLFSDIRGFTSLSERMSPEGLVAFINQYLTPMTDIVFEQGGTLDKYIGDAIMAFWGAPVDQPDHALRACRAALRFVEKLEELRVRWRAEGLPEVDIGVGINTGPMNVGHMGTESRFNYTVMGDAVNLGSRLEGLTKVYGIRILLAEATHRQVAGHVITRRLGAVRVMGKREPVALHELRGLGQPVGPEAEAIRAFEEGVDRFAARDWDGAEARFRAVLALWPRDVPSMRYLEEISTFRRMPPGPEWDGVHTATTK
jgi:adenylate cyclase